MRIGCRRHKYNVDRVVFGYLDGKGARTTPDMERQKKREWHITSTREAGLLIVAHSPSWGALISFFFPLL